MGKEKEKKAPEPASEEFLDAISSGHGALRATCEFCGREYFASNGDYDEGELEKLNALAEKHPEKYINTGEDWQSLCSIGGRDYVYGCPCNAPRQYEDFIWAHRWPIAKYLKTRSKNQLKDQIHDYRQIKAIPNDLPDGPGRPGKRRLGSPRRVESECPPAKEET